jgi:hypothetical protein
MPAPAVGGGISLFNNPDFATIMKPDTKTLLEAANSALYAVPATNRHIYVNGFALREFYQNQRATLPRSDQDAFELLIVELGSHSNDPLTPFRGISNPVNVLGNPAFEGLGSKALHDRLEATAIFKESFALMEPLVAEVRRLEALLEAEQREAQP